jgi:hypothetical protein
MTGGIPVGIYLNHQTHKLYMPMFYGSNNGIVVSSRRWVTTR